MGATLLTGKRKTEVIFLEFEKGKSLRVFWNLRRVRV